MTEKAAPEPVAWLIRWTERDTPCSMLVDGDPGPAAEDETITPLYTHPAERVAMLESLLRAALPYIKYPRDATDAFVIAHDKMVERICAALGEGT